MQLRNIFIAWALISLFSAFAAAATPQTFLTITNETLGTTQTFTPSDGSFSVSSVSYLVSIVFHTPDYSQFWLLYFGSPTTLAFERGEYDYASGISSATRPFIDVDGGCSQTTGRFLVSDFALNTDATIARVAIDFEQDCYGSVQFYGSFRYNSAVPAIPRLSAASTYALKGNAGTSDAPVILSLCLPSTSIVQVTYATADGTAVQGTDYENTTGTATFQPGVTSQTITVPIIGDFLARGNKTFKVKLSAAAGAPIIVPTATVLIRDPNVALTALAISSQPGDYIGRGLQYLITLSDGTFTAQNSANVFTVSINNGYGWETDFAGPTSARLVRGDYENVQRYPFQPAGIPGLNVAGDGRGCNNLAGNFQVLQAGYNSSSVLQDFSANFEQHCEGAVPALFGWLRYHTKLQQFSVTDAVISGSSAVFTVTLNPSNATSLSVNFATANGTAVAGTDYVSTSQAITFSPGVTEQTVTVPLLNPGGSSKTFYGELSTPTGAPVWIGQGSATF